MVHLSFLPKRRSVILMPLAFGLCAVYGADAIADAGDVLRPYVGLMVAHDDNLFHLSNSDQAQTFLGSSSLADTYRRLSAGIDIEKQFSQQRLIASLNLSRTRFNHYSQLDNDGKDLSVALNWHLGTHIDGNVGTSYVETLTPFAEFRTQERNLRTQKHIFADAGWRFHPAWRVRGSVSGDRLDYALQSQRASDRDLTAEEIGLDYLAADNGTIGVQVGHSTGAYRFKELIGPFAVANDYSQTEVLGKADWLVTGKTRLQFLGGWVERKHDAFSERDYRGVSARATAIVKATGKVTFTGSLWHEIGSVDDLAASYSVNNGISLNTVWDATSKLRMELVGRDEKRDYSGTAALPILQLSTRKSTYRYLSLTGTYVPTRNWQLALTGYHDQQSSNVDVNSYRSNGLMFNSRYQY